MSCRCITASYTRFLLFFASLLMLAGLLVFAGWWLDESIVYDNHLVENLQVLFLLLAAMLHGRYAMLWRDSRLDSYVRVFMVFFCIAFLLRELDIKSFGERELWDRIEQALRWLVGLPYLAWLLFLLSKTAFLWSQRQAVFRSPLFHLTVAGCLCYVIGWPFDKKLFTGLSFAQAQLGEEILELWGTSLLLAAAWWPAPLQPQAGNPR